MEVPRALPVGLHFSSDHKEQRSWIPVETYIQDRTDAEFSHGLCPECLKKLYGFKYDT